MSWTRSAWLEKVEGWVVEEVEGEEEEKKQTLSVNIKRGTVQHFHRNYRVDEGLNDGLPGENSRGSCIDQNSEETTDLYSSFLNASGNMVHFVLSGFRRLVTTCKPFSSRKILQIYQIMNLSRPDQH